MVTASEVLDPNIHRKELIQVKESVAVRKNQRKLNDLVLETKINTPAVMGVEINV
jgi:hypothetical protein